MATAPPRQRRKDARPRELLDAALDVFVRKGFAATRTEEVAAHAGVSKGTLYLYYPSKKELLKAVIRERLSSAIAAGADEVARHEGSAAALLAGSMVRWWQSIVDSPASGVFKLVITEVRNFPEIADFYDREVVEPGHHLIGEVLRRGIATGEFRAVDIDSTVYSIVLPMVMLCLHKHSLAACTTVASSRGRNARVPVLDPQAFIAQHFELVLRGLRAGDAAAHASRDTAVPALRHAARRAA
jgi:AcrR family transcriptional regulator